MEKKLNKQKQKRLNNDAICCKIIEQNKIYRKQLKKIVIEENT